MIFETASLDDFCRDTSATGMVVPIDIMAIPVHTKMPLLIVYVDTDIYKSVAFIRSVMICIYIVVQYIT